jgi:hypothetical protein
MERLHKAMPSAGKWALAIVPAGIALGALLGTAAAPEPTEPSAQWWQLTGREDIAIVADGRQFVEAGPEDLAVHGGLRPDLDYDAEVWTLPVSDYDFAYLQGEPLDPPAHDPPRVRYGVTAAESAADEAEAAAADALDSGAPAQPEPAKGDVRKSELALAGLY